MSDPYMECDIYRRHGACSCSTGVPGNVCPLDVDQDAGQVPPRNAHDVGQVCICVTNHNPEPQELNRHHVWPLGEGGPNTPANVVWLCPTAHANVHELLRLYVRHEGAVPWVERRRFGSYVRALAKEGYHRIQTQAMPSRHPVLGRLS